MLLPVALKEKIKEKITDMNIIFSTRQISKFYTKNISN